MSTNLSKKRRITKQKSVTFASPSNLETVHIIEPLCSKSEHETLGDDNIAESSIAATSQLTEEIKILSSEHGRARRHLREIPKQCLQTAIKYGTKTKANKDQKTGLTRWKYTFANIVYITDFTSTKEITSFKEAVSIAAAPITTDMINRHEYVKRTIKEEPHMCTSHFVVIVDQSGSMRNSDVNGFRNRSQAAYGCLALDCVAEQLSQIDGNMNAGIDTFTVIEMNDSASVVIDREPLDWILFNKLLSRQTKAKPRSHGNYEPSLQVARDIIRKELKRLDSVEPEDFPAFAMIFLSDGKPSDKNEMQERIDLISSISMELKEKFTFYGMGIGANGSDFGELELLCMTAKTQGSKGEFNHAGLSVATLGEGFSNVASSMSTMRSELLSKTDNEDESENNAKLVVPLKHRNSFAKSMDHCWKELSFVNRLKFKLEAWEKDLSDEHVWNKIPMIYEKRNAQGFAMDVVPFGEGRERQAFRFYEVDESGDLIGKMLVAKETRGVRSEKKKFHFHEHFCRIQVEAKRFAKLFNKEIHNTKSLHPIDDGESPPPRIDFVKCFVYEYLKDHEEEAGILVEHYLKGKFTKYNGNNGFVNGKAEKDPITIKLESGIVSLIDFIQAFSHWTYVKSDHRLLLCDLQGVLDKEGKRPIFKLTDPAICSSQKNGRTKKYGRTDIGLKGIRQFFRAHKCNLVCTCLGLPQG